MAIQRAVAVLALAGLAVAPLGCGDDGAESSPKARSGPSFHEKVVIKKDGYHPKAVRVLAGGTVTWTNRDPTKDHTAETTDPLYKDLPGNEDASFDTHTLSWGEPYTVTFHKPGVYEYTSSYDFGWKGTVEVVTLPPPRK